MSERRGRGGRDDQREDGLKKGRAEERKSRKEEELSR
jgi:hypothetical protein